MKNNSKLICSFSFNELDKIIKIMRNTVLILLISISQAFAINGYSQNTRLSLDLKNTSIKEVLANIEDHSEFYFLYNSELIDVTRKVDISSKNKKISDILNNLFDKNEVRVLINDKYIILTPKTFGIQQIIITGKVTDESGQPLPGVDVVVKGTSNGVATDFDGNYSIASVPSDATLVFSFVGMKSKEVPVADRTVINVTLSADVNNLDEVVLVGYSSVKKRDITGSISSISSKDISKAGTTNLAQAVQGKTSGVLITRKSGKPGKGVSVRIRGVGGINNSEPLYVVDGIYGGSLDGINPDEIQSIEVLKDASSAAIYGARGANGVVLITTKRGRAGNMKITYNGSIGFQNMINTGDVKLLNAQQYGEVQNTMYRNDGQPEPFGGNPDLPSDLFPSPNQLGAGTDWIDVMFNNNAPIQNHLLSFSGGSEKHTAYISISYLNQEGMGIRSGMERLNFRINSDHTIKKWLKIGNSTSFGDSKVTGDDRTDHKYGQFFEITMKEPTIPVYNEDGTLAGPPHPFYGPSRTPYAKAVTSDPVFKGFGLSNNLYAEFKPWDFLTFRTSFNNNYSASENVVYKNNIFNEGIVSGEEVNVSASNSVSKGWTWSNILNFNKEFGKHNVHALAGYEKRYSSWNSINGFSKYLDPSFHVVGSGAAETSSFNQYRGEESMVSYFGSVNYNYNDKYYFTGNIRYDGSSRFGENNRFGLFPSFSVAWRLSNENFIPEFFSDLKLRASWGQVGNDKIGNYRYIAPMANVFYSFTGQNGSFESGMVTKGLANTDLKWETSTQTDFGVDMAFMDNKLRLVADYFITDVTDMLLGKTIPVTSGIGSLTWGRYVSVITNVGALTNKGFEFEASYNNSVGDFRYSVHANMTTYSNEVTDLGENEYLSGTSGEVRNRTYVGGSLGDFYGYVCEGIFQTQAELDAANALNPDAPYQTNETIPGDFKFKDLNGDGVITDKDRTIIGSPIPDFTYGFGFDFGYKRFSLTTLFYGNKGNMIYNAQRSEMEQQGRSGNKSTTVLNAWHGEGTSNTIPIRRVQDLNNNFRTSTAYLEDGSFLRLQNIVFAYDIPVTFAKMQVFVSGDNLLTFTKYSGYNPEVSISQAGEYSGGSRLDSGVDAGYYPSSSVYRLGVNITF
jgi:TonB-linked SusC/RagA family outer membrane protein